MDEFETDQRAEPLTWQAVTAVALSGLGAVMEEVGDGLEALARLLFNAHHHELQRRTFHEQAALEIETLIRGPE